MTEAFEDFLRIVFGVFGSFIVLSYILSFFKVFDEFMINHAKEGYYYYIYIIDIIIYDTVIIVSESKVT